MIGFAFGADNVASANRASLRHLERFVTAGMVFVFHHARDFRDYVATTFDFHPVADLYPEAFDFIHVVERGTADRGAADRNRLQRRYRR